MHVQFVSIWGLPPRPLLDIHSIIGNPFLKFLAMLLSYVHWMCIVYHVNYPLHSLKHSLGVGAVASFVEVANSTTTGEEDFNLDRLSMLHSVATGYSSLIFDMKPYMGFAEFCKQCNNLWKALEENPELPQYLVRNMIVLNITGP